MEEGRSWTEWLLGGPTDTLLPFTFADVVNVNSTLQSLNLPGSIQALDRPIGLPPSLIKKAEEVDSAGGVQKIRGLLAEVDRLSRSNAKLLSDVRQLNLGLGGLRLSTDTRSSGNGHSGPRSD